MKLEMDYFNSSGEVVIYSNGEEIFLLVEVTEEQVGILETILKRNNAFEEGGVVLKLLEKGV